MGTILIYGGSGGIGSALASELNCSFTVGEVRGESIFKKRTAATGEPSDGLVYCVGMLNLGSI